MQPPRWSAPDRPEYMDVQALLEAADSSAVFRSLHPSELPDIPAPTHFRACCAFGSNLRVRIGRMPVPGFDLTNVLGPDQLGHHYYDNGMVQRRRTREQSGEGERERNGLVYTCRGGFIDVAHVRNWVDWATFLATTIARTLETGTVVRLPPKGGRLSLHVRGTDPELIERVGRLPATLPLAQWAAYQMSIWDEISTWYGWSHLALFSEQSSAFSPEDLYSNLVGLKIMTAVYAQGAARTETLFNDSVDRWLTEVLHWLGAVDREVGHEAARAVEGLWWDARRALPDMDLVRRRNMAVHMPLVPWLVPVDRMPPSLRVACGDAPAPLPLAISERDLEDLALFERVTLQIEAGPPIVAREPFHSMGRVLTQVDFPEILSFIRADAQRRFGARALEPD